MNLMTRSRVRSSRYMLIISAVAACSLAMSVLGADNKTELSLRDCDLAVVTTRVVPSIRTTVPCRPDIVEFIPKEDNIICIVTVTITPEKNRTLRLIPELFTAFNSHIQFHSHCDGLRVVSPEQHKYYRDSFIPTCEAGGVGGDWPDRAREVKVEAGQSVTIELAFQFSAGNDYSGIHIFAAIPIGDTPAASKQDATSPRTAPIRPTLAPSGAMRGRSIGGHSSPRTALRMVGNEGPDDIRLP